MTRYDLLVRSSIPLRQLDSCRLPVNFASGCLAMHNGAPVLLTVLHAAGNGDGWAAEVRFVNRFKGTVLYTLSGIQFLEEIDAFTGERRRVDFCFFDMKPCFQPMYQEIAPDDSIVLELPRIQCNIDTVRDPSNQESYGFAGQIAVSVCNGLLPGKVVCHDSLTFRRTEGDYHVFSLQEEYPGHDQLKGCSGAPIIDTRGNAVALVCKGNSERNEIWGVSLRKYALMI